MENQQTVSQEQVQQTNDDKESQQQTENQHPKTYQTENQVQMTEKQQTVQQEEQQLDQGEQSQQQENIDQGLNNENSQQKESNTQQVDQQIKTPKSIQNSQQKLGPDIQQTQRSQQLKSQQEQEEQIEEIDEQILDVQSKLDALSEQIPGKSEEEIVSIRQKQLGYAKFLLFLFNIGQDRLVEAHTDLGEAYLNFKCYEQSIEHLTIALKINGELFNDNDQKKHYHSYILTLLGKCYVEINNPQDSLQLLNKALEIQQSLKLIREEKMASIEDDPNNEKNQIQELNEQETAQNEQLAQIHTVIANCFTILEQYNEALYNIELVIDIAEKQGGKTTESYALACIEAARIFSLKQDYESSIQFQEKAIEQLSKLEDKQLFLSEQYTTLGHFYEKVGQVDKNIECLREVKQMYVDIYGYNDPAVIKQKRQLALVLLDQERHHEALQELIETEELETNLYTEKSINVAKTQKIIGTIYILLKESENAVKYLQKAHKIFEDAKMKRMADDLKLKIKMAKESYENNYKNQKDLNYIMEENNQN